MRILDKYITRYFLPPFLYCLLTFILLYVIIDLFGHLDEVLKQSISIFILNQYYMAMIPLIITQAAPLSALISTIYVLGTMNKNGEITAMRAAGISMFRVLIPFLFLGLAISMAVFLISEKIVPQGMKTVESIKENHIEKNEKNKTTDKKIISNIAVYGRNNRLIFIDAFDNHDKTVRGVTILQQDKKGNVSSKMNAHEGKWTGGRWIFYNILLYKLNDKGIVMSNPVFFEEKGLDIENPAELLSKGANYEFMSHRDLSNYINNFSSASQKMITRLRVDLHRKVSFPFTSMVVMLIGIGSAIKINQRSKVTAIMGVGVSMLIGFVYYAVMASCIALGKSGILPPPVSAHLANFIFGLIGILLIRN
ncbi:MAG: LptF/LptG family permease [Candidatus Omnitrophota bacterium]